MKIDLRNAMQTLEMLQGNIKKMDQVAEMLESEIPVTTSMESFKNLAAPMRSQLESVREETRAMRQMALALEQVCRMVDQCERHVIDEIEQERVVFERFHVRKILVPKTQFEHDPLKIIW